MLGLKVLVVKEFFFSCVVDWFDASVPHSLKSVFYFLLYYYYFCFD